MIYADLHMHTKNSDGSLSNEEIIQHALKQGIKGLAVTDHQSFSEQKNIKKIAESSGLEYITGIELKTTIQQSLDKHGFSKLLATSELLVYGLNENPALADLGKMITKHVALRKKYYELTRKEYASHDYSEIEGYKITGQIIVTPEEMEAKNKKGINLFNIIRERAGVSYTAMKNFYVGIIQPAVFPNLKDDPFTSLDTLDAITKARKWGKLVVLAHPLTESRKELTQFYEKAMPDLVEAGLQGIELDYPEHNNVDKKRIINLAKKYKLIMTGGSDFHKPDGSIYVMGCCGVDKLTFMKIQKICS